MNLLSDDIKGEYWFQGWVISRDRLYCTGNVTILIGNYITVGIKTEQNNKPYDWIRYIGYTDNI